MEKFEIQRIHADRGALENALRQAGAVFKGKQIGCVWHADKNPSGSVYQNEAGEWRFKCHACGVIKDVLDVQAFIQSKPIGEILKDATEEVAPLPRVFTTVDALVESCRAMWTVDDFYPYTNPDTCIIDMVVIRCLDSSGKKKILQARPERGGYVMKSPVGLKPLFNRKAMRAAQTIFVVEGEKCVKAMRDAGWTSTTSPGGADNPHNADWSPCAGKNLIFWRDNDDPGENYQKVAIQQCERLNPRPKISIVDISRFELPDGGDCFDYIQTYGCEDREFNRALIEEIAKSAEGTGPSAAVRKLIAATISGVRYAVSWPWPMLDGLTNALLPGTCMAVCGDPAASKSFFLLHAARHWHREKVPFAVYQLESDEDGSHLLRALVQHHGNLGMLDWKWIRDNPDEAERIESENREFVDSFGANLWTPPAAIPSLEELTEWVRERANEGRRVIGVDPITAADTGKQRWDDDRKFVLNCQSICRSKGASLIIVTHPKLTAKTGAMAEIGGGAAYSRFTQTVIWIKAHHPPKDVSIVASFGTQETVNVNRTIKISKSRLGRGTGYELAYRFGDGMLFQEVGEIEKKREGGECP